MKQHTRIGKLDACKWFCTLLVVANHTSPLESINATADFLLTRVLARVTVPFFFMVTGYFVLSKAGREHGFPRILTYMKKLAVYYLVLTLLYLPVQLYRTDWTSAPALFQNALRGLIFDGTFYHLWYLPAQLLGLPIAYGVYRLGEKKAFGIAGILYVVGLFGDSYYGFIEKLPPIKGFYEGMFSLFSYTRNGLFYAPLFLLLGCKLADKKNSELGVAIGNTVICLILMGVEAILLHVNGMQRHDSMYLLLPVTMFWWFQTCLALPPGRKERDSFFLRGPALVYFLHPMVILLLRGFVKLSGLTVLLTVSPLYYLVVMAGSVCMVWLLLKGKKEVEACIRKKSPAEHGWKSRWKI